MSAAIDRIWQDLQPAPGRLAGSLRILLASLLTLVILMTLQMPFASIGLYVVFFVARDTPASSLRSAILVLFVLVLAVAIELSVVIVSDNDPMARVLSVAVVTFLAGMLMGATTAPFLGAAGGFVFASVIALWETAAPADTLVKLSLWLPVTAATALGCAVFVEYAFGYRHPAERLEGQRRMRYQALEAMFRLYAIGAPKEQIAAAGTRVARMAAPGQSGMQEIFSSIVSRNLPTGHLPLGSRARITMLAELMDVSAAFAAHHAAAEDEAVRLRCVRIADACRDLLGGLSVSLGIEPAVHVTLLDRVEGALHAIASMPVDSAGVTESYLVKRSAKKTPFLIPGAFTRPETVAFGLKISLCATLCYIFYHAVGWPGISTSVLTVLLTGAGHSGAIKQKLTYRLLGSAIGGLIAIAATVYLFPHMDSIASLVVLVGAVAFVAAWVASGPRFSYVGMQIAFSFYLVAFEGPRAPVDLSPPRDRLVGIFVALIVMWFVFDQLWPVRTVTAMRRALASILRSQSKLFRLFETTRERDQMLQEVDSLRDQVSTAVAGMRTMNSAVAFEYGADRDAQMRLGEGLLHASLTAVGLFWNQLTVLYDERDQDFLDEPHLVEMRRKLAGQLDAMAEAVARSAEPPGVDISSFANAELLANPRYGDYARNALTRYQDLAVVMSGLQA